MLDFSMGFILVFMISSRLGGFLYEKSAALEAHALDMASAGRASHVGAMVMWILWMVTPKSATRLHEYWRCWSGALLIASAIGYIGCFSYGCCYGSVVAQSHPFAIRFPVRQNAIGSITGAPAAIAQMKAGRLALAARESLPVHPTQLYHAALLAIGGVFVCAFSVRAKTSRCFMVSITYYMLVRCLLDPYRGDHMTGSSVYEHAPVIRRILLGLILAISVYYALTTLKKR
jgi:prolipoprotein diacylglyceryltransferase